MGEVCTLLSPSSHCSFLVFQVLSKKEFKIPLTPTRHPTQLPCKQMQTFGHSSHIYYTFDEAMLVYYFYYIAISYNTLITISHCQLYCCIQSEYPTTPPSVNVLCVAPAGAVDCHYKRDLCCCGHCPEKFTFSCQPDSTTGAGVWKAKHLPICPAEGCGDEGAMLVLQIS